jgi:hypothetical protein
MHARIVTGKAVPGKIDELATKWRDIFGAQLKSMAGFRQGIFTGDRATNALVGITLWESEPDMAELHRHMMAFASQVGGLIAGPPQDAVYEVLAEV